MTTSSLLFGVAVVVVLGFYLTEPWRRRRGGGLGRQSASRRQQLMAQKAAIYAAIREIDTDVQTGKLEPADHRALRRRYVSEAVGVLSALDEQEPEDLIGSAIEADLMRLKEGRLPAAPDSAPGGRFCAACGAAIDAGDRFCAGCGAKVEE
jgi:hypothetical protein